MTANDLLEIARLAALDSVDYARERKAAAKAMGIPVATLDKEVNTARASFGTGATATKPLTLTEIVPYPTSVDGVELVGETIAAFGRHVIIGEPEKLIAAFWTAHAHTVEACSISPRLAVTSPFPESGKSTLMKVVRHLVPRPLHVVTMTGPTLFRVIEISHPVMLLDEVNNWLTDRSAGASDGTKGDLMALIDAGHERGVIVPRLMPSGNGAWEPHGFDIFGPMALALIGKLPEQIASRSIEIACMRRTADQPITPLYARRPPPELAEIASKWARWSADHVDLLKEWPAEIPPEISNRTADNFEPLLVIAEVIEDEAVGPGSSRPDYPRLLREAAIAASKGSRANRLNSNPRLTLLADLLVLFDSEWAMHQDPKNPRPLFTEAAKVVLFSEDIVTALAELEDRPWAEWGRARKPISKVQLARQLAPLGISPSTHDRGSLTAKGYVRRQFETSWKKYL
jgi:putative DNA primase/helicase